MPDWGAGRVDAPGLGHPGILVRPDRPRPTTPGSSCPPPSPAARARPRCSSATVTWLAGSRSRGRGSPRCSFPAGPSRCPAPRSPWRPRPAPRRCVPAAADGTDTTQWIGPTAEATIQVDLGRTVPLGSVTVTRNPVTTFASTTGGKGVTMPTKSAGERVEASADGIQAAHSAARVRRQAACAEPPARPTVAHTRTATTGRSAPVPTSSSSGSSRRGENAWRSDWVRG